MEIPEAAGSDKVFDVEVLSGVIPTGHEEYDVIELQPVHQW